MKNIKDYILEKKIDWTGKFVKYIDIMDKSDEYTIYQVVEDRDTRLLITAFWNEKTNELAQKNLKIWAENVAMKDEMKIIDTLPKELTQFLKTYKK